MPFFSIIVPIYNTSAYLESCICSLRDQSFDDIEIIAVDDASSDGSKEVVESLSHEDHRIISVVHDENRGSHAARKTGVEHACGSYILFVDSDDRLNDDVCKRLYDRLIENPVDILHYGITAVSEMKEYDFAARDFERWANVPFDILNGDDLLKAVCLELDGKNKDWNMTHRAFSASLIVDAFSKMADCRLERAEDCYEFYVIASIAKNEETDNAINGYLYHIGRGVTGYSTITVPDFIKSAREVKKSFEAIQAYSRSLSEDRYLDYSSGLKAKLIESIANEWLERVDDEEKKKAAVLLAKEIGPYEVACELMRFVRDEAYELWSGGSVLTGSERLLDWVDLAGKIVEGAKPSGSFEAYHKMKKIALGHVNDLKRRQLFQERDSEKIRIFVSTHKEVDLFSGRILQPVQVGSCSADSRFPWAYHDDEGDCISEMNPLYCEVTTQYWVWKNVDAEYYGFCHYRRYFDFSENRHEENQYGEIIDTYIDEAAQHEYGLDDRSIETLVRQYDVITTEFKDLRRFPDTKSTPYGHYESAPLLHIEDLNFLVSVLNEMHPEYEQDVKTFLYGNKSCFCNMFIMRKEIFQEYCSWLFPILEEFVKRSDMALYSQEALRTPGHLAERLLNIYYIHQMRTGANWRTKQLQCVHFEQPELHTALDRAFEAPAIPIVFAADNNYIPQLAVALYSLVVNSSSSKLYDIVILNRDIDYANMKRVKQCIMEGHNNISLRFYNVSHIVENYKLEANCHISTETYYRFLIQSILPDYDKVLYLDSDLVVNSDVSELFDVELGDELIGAVLDADYLGNLNMNDGLRMKYSKEKLHMKDPYSYFQAGVLLMNTNAMRQLHSLDEWLSLASEPYLYNDQDILNAHCEGRVLYLNYAWNVMIDSGRLDLAIKYAPAQVHKAYLESRENPKIIHYAGGVKPWNDVSCDFADSFWEYARATPFYEELIAGLSYKWAGPSEDLLDKAYVYTVTRHGTRSIKRKIGDFFLPYGSRRRELTRKVAKRILYR